MNTPPPGNGTLAYRVDRLEEQERDRRDEIKELKDRVDRLIMSVIGAGLTFTVSIIVLAITRNI